MPTLIWREWKNRKPLLPHRPVVPKHHHRLTWRVTLFSEQSMNVCERMLKRRNQWTAFSCIILRKMAKWPSNGVSPHSTIYSYSHSSKILLESNFHFIFSIRHFQQLIWRQWNCIKDHHKVPMPIRRSVWVMMISLTLHLGKSIHKSLLWKENWKSAATLCWRKNLHHYSKPDQNFKSRFNFLVFHIKKRANKIIPVMQF